MECVPTASVLTEHAAVRVLPAPTSATAPHPLSELPPSLKLTVPLGLAPLTVAVNVTTFPNVDGLAELAIVVVVALATVATVKRTSSTKPVKSPPLPTPSNPTVWLPVLPMVNEGV